MKDLEYRKKVTLTNKKSFNLNIDKRHAANNLYIRSSKGRYKLAIRIAKRRKLEWGLTKEEYELAIKSNCYYCDYNLGKATEAGTGLDRIDNSKGYINGNILSCCSICNRIRTNQLTVEETFAAIQAILLFRSK